MQIKVKSYSELFAHEDYRWDGEYLCFEPYKNSKLTYLPIGEILIQSQYGISIEMNEEGNGTQIYRMNEITNMFCDRNVNKYAKIGREEIDAFKLIDRDVLFNRTNSQVFVGRTGIFREFSENEFVFASYLIRVKPDESKVLPEYLTAFLNTKYGVLDVKRRARISINQSNVNAEELKRVEIPLIDSELQKQIRNAFDKAFLLINKSEGIYKESESILLSELGLLDWHPKHQLSFIKNYSDTEKTGRFDAEYYQPKYDAIVKAIKRYEGGWDTMENLVNIKDRNHKPKAKQAYKYIELANIGGNGEITDRMIEEGQDLPSRARRKVAAGDVIVSSIEGSLSSIALIEKEYDQALCSTGFYVVNSKSLNSATLLVLLKSIVGQLQLKKGCSGTILTAINKEEFKKIVLPVVDNDIQTKIQQKINESFNLRKQSKHLLECAKKAVEITIEKDEQTAINWISEQTEKF
jgi:type I restriction enzyme S subunit